MTDSSAPKKKSSEATPEGSENSASGETHQPTSTPPSTPPCLISSPSSSVDTYSRRTNQITSPASFHVAVGGFLHDVDERKDKTLLNYAGKLSSMTVFDVFFDYTRVISQDARQPAHEFDAHMDLNRYRDIRCIDATRVAVPVDGHDYIHANFVDGFREEKRFILTQAPLKESVERFWAMIYQEKCTVVLALTILDGARTPAYVPIRGGVTAQYGPYKVTNMGTRHVRKCYDGTMVHLSKGDEAPRKLLLIVFYAWPDKGTPLVPTEVLYLLEDTNYNRNLLIEEGKQAGWLKGDKPISPIVIHCLAGVGRSGALAALDICARKLDYTYKRDCGPRVDVRDTVLRLRSQREMAVQKPEQYLFVHLAVLEYAIRKRYFDSVDCVDLSKFLRKK